MRTVREMARVLGWPEARKQPDHVHYPLSIDSFPSPPPAVVSGPISMHLEQSPKLRLRISHSRVLVGTWVWRVVDSEGCWIDNGRAASWSQALAVGLAALDAAHAQARR